MNENLIIPTPEQILFYLDANTIITKADLDAVFSKYTYVQNYTFNKSANGIGFQYGRHRSNPKNTYYEPIVSIQNTIPKHIYLKGYYSQGNQTLMFFSVSIKRGSGIMRFISIHDTDARAMVNNGILLDESISNAKNELGRLDKTVELSETIEYDIDVQTDNFRNFMSTYTGDVTLNIESSSSCLSSTGNSWTALPFYVQKLIIT